ncbi:MAG TPA: FMN-binding negative transcriptional regulator [Terracidiphilus sp.]|nr:FMN-binding negative transcriptional regulator [Terracidiphilus sp.]
MFVRPCWQPDSPQDALDLIEQNPWALLVSNGTQVPFATNLPLLLDRTSEEIVLFGHIARGNEHYRSLASRADGAKVLAIFEGPWSYVTASWYPKRDMPSTYYYTAVHCTGTLGMQTEAELDESLEELTRRMESHYPGGWRTSEIPRSEIVRRFSAIAGFRIRVSTIESKFKLGQDEPLPDALAVAGVLERQSSPQDRELAALIRRLNSSRQQ